MKTSTPKLPAPTWYVVDATDQTIGRIATKAAHVLRGKHKATFSPNSVTGDHVIVLNIEKMKVDPMKAMKKTQGVTIIAGGDTIDATRKYGNLGDYSHVSLAGGATLEFLAGKELPALIPLVKALK